MRPGDISGAGDADVPHRPRRPGRAGRPGAGGRPVAHPVGRRPRRCCPSGADRERHGAPGQPARWSSRPSSARCASRCRCRDDLRPGGYRAGPCFTGLTRTCRGRAGDRGALRRRRRLGDDGRRRQPRARRSPSAPASAPAAGSSCCRARRPARGSLLGGSAFVLDGDLVKPVEARRPTRPPPPGPPRPAEGTAMSFRLSAGRSATRSRSPCCSSALTIAGMIAYVDPAGQAVPQRHLPGR